MDLMTIVEIVLLGLVGGSLFGAVAIAGANAKAKNSNPERPSRMFAVYAVGAVGLTLLTVVTFIMSYPNPA